MKTIIKYLRFPFSFSEEKMVAELNALSQNWIMHFNKAHYDGEWSALPLRSINGSISNVLPENKTDGEFRDTELMDQCPYIKSITRYFDCEHNATRLLKLRPGAIIREHRDGDLAYEKGEARIHIPITTNAQIDFYVESDRLDLRPGECWYMNFDLPHRLANNGNTDRVHLVMDIKINDRIREMFESAGPENVKYKQVNDGFSRDESALIIEQLRQLNTPVALQIAEELEEKII